MDGPQCPLMTQNGHRAVRPNDRGDWYPLNVQRNRDSDMGCVSRQSERKSTQMAASQGQSCRSKLVAMPRVVTSVLGWISEIREAAKNLFSPKHPSLIENRAESVIAEARGAEGGTGSTEAKSTAAGSFTTAPTADLNVGPIASSGISQTVPDQEEVERRRTLVRALFNDFWNGADNKPAAFAQRLDQAEDYLNARLAGRGEFWRLDPNTRAMLGLPPRSSSAD